MGTFSGIGAVLARLVPAIFLVAALLMASPASASVVLHFSCAGWDDRSQNAAIARIAWYEGRWVMKPEIDAERNTLQFQALEALNLYRHRARLAYLRGNRARLATVWRRFERVSDAVMEGTANSQAEFASSSLRSRAWRIGYDILRHRAELEGDISLLRRGLPLLEQYVEWANDFSPEIAGGPMMSRLYRIKIWVENDLRLLAGRARLAVAERAPDSLEAQIDAMGKLLEAVREEDRLWRDRDAGTPPKDSNRFHGEWGKQIPIHLSALDAVLGAAQFDLGVLAGDDERVAGALATLDIALSFLRADCTPLKWGRIQIERGKVLTYQARRANELALVDEETGAIAVLRQAVDAVSFHAMPLEWAKGQRALAEAYATHFEMMPHKRDYLAALADNANALANMVLKGNYQE